MFTVPGAPKAFRWIVIITGIALFLWLSREDNSVRSVTFYGLMVALLALVAWIADRFGGQTLRPSRLIPFAALIGAGLGLSTGLATTTLMLLKSAMHSHVVPDYPPGLMAATLERIPAWSVAGALTGLALALLWIATRTPEPDSP